MAAGHGEDERRFKVNEECLKTQLIVTAFNCFGFLEAQYEILLQYCQCDLARGVAFATSMGEELYKCVEIWYNHVGRVSR